ncbi:MAG: MOSC domain-containing protein [Acetobacteraceae bacterium]|nr:MOSC domain-containing protein [Acetobacteraceae bacterium]
MNGTVVAVSRSPRHSFSKDPQLAIRLLAGLGVEGDAHAGATVKHRSRVAQNPSQPNLRQVHLIGQELLDELTAKGFRVWPGAIGENITTSGLDLLRMPLGTRLGLGESAVVELTGLRNPCRQLDKFQSRLMAAVLDRDEDGQLILRAGVMGVVLAGGTIRPGDPIAAILPQGVHRKLARV